jgi:alcohol dehydrogenase class IV
MIAIPTTAGTGAEVTRTCIVTDRDGRKVWTWGDALLPDLVVLDPASTVTMPTHVTAATGLDAFVHALEAVSGRRSTALVTAPALHAMRLVVDHLPIAVAAPNDLGARQAMQEAALLAGLAIDGGGTGIAHSIGHALGTLAHVPHGVAVAIGLAAALDWNVEGAADAYASAAAALGRPAAELPDLLAELLAAVTLSAAIRRLPALELEPDQIAASMVAEENLPMYRNNCRLADDAERRHLAVRTLAVWNELRTN